MNCCGGGDKNGHCSHGGSTGSGTSWVVTAAGILIIVMLYQTDKIVRIYSLGATTYPIDE